MRGISVRNPWAWAILHGKPVENRGRPGWPLGEYALHASKMPAKPSEAQFYELVDEMQIVRSMAERDGIKIPEITWRKLHAMSGAIIGVMQIVDCVRTHPSAFYVGPFGLVLQNVRRIEPVPCKGSLGPWVVPADVELVVRGRLEASQP